MLVRQQMNEEDQRQKASTTKNNQLISQNNQGGDENEQNIDYQNILLEIDNQEFENQIRAHIQGTNSVKNKLCFETKENNIFQNIEQLNMAKYGNKQVLCEGNYVPKQLQMVQMFEQKSISKETTYFQIADQIKKMANYMISFQQNKNDQLTQAEFQQLVSKLKSQLPEQMTFQQFIKKCKIKQGCTDQQPKYQPIQFDSNAIQNELLYEINIPKSYYQQNQELKAKLNKYRELIVYFCEHEVTKQHLNQGVKINDDTFVSKQELQHQLKIIFITMFRRLEQYIYNVCKKEIVALTVEDVTKVLLYLFNWKQALKQERVNFLKKTMKYSFDIPTKIIQSEQIDLYCFLLSLVKIDRQVQKETKQMADNTVMINNKIVWNKDIQRDICVSFLTSKKLWKSNEGYGEQFTPLTDLNLKMFFEKVLKRAFRKYQSQYLLIDPTLKYPINLSQKEMRAILTSTNSLHIRLLLISLYLSEDIYIEDLFKITKAISDLNQQKNTINTKSIEQSLERQLTSSQNQNNSKDNQVFGQGQQQRPKRTRKQKSIMQILKTQKRNQSDKKQKIVIQSEEDQQSQQIMPKSKNRLRKYLMRDQSSSNPNSNKKQLTIMQTFQQKSKNINNLAEIPSKINSYAPKKLKEANYSQQFNKNYQQNASIGNRNSRQTQRGNLNDIMVENISKKFKMELNAAKKKR